VNLTLLEGVLLAWVALLSGGWLGYYLRMKNSARKIQLLQGRVRAALGAVQAFEQEIDRIERKIDDYSAKLLTQKKKPATSRTFDQARKDLEKLYYEVLEAQEQ
jgi:Na+/phosphate symporter